MGYYTLYIRFNDHYRNLLNNYFNKDLNIVTIDEIKQAINDNKDNINLTNVFNAFLQYTNRPNYHSDAGVDLVHIDDTIVNDCGVTKVDLGIMCEMTHTNETFIGTTNCAFDLRPRSSMSNSPFTLANCIGTFDMNYRGPVISALDALPHRVKSSDRITVMNSSTELSEVTDKIMIKAGTRLVQICTPTLEPIKVVFVNELSKTDRNINGFGSSGGSFKSA